MQRRLSYQRGRVNPAVGWSSATTPMASDATRLLALLRNGGAEMARLFLNTGATAAAVAYDCTGVYLETYF